MSNKFTPDQKKRIAANKDLAWFMGEKAHNNDMFYLLSTPHEWNDLIKIIKKFDDLDLGCPYYIEACDRVDNAVTTYDINKAYEEICKAIKWYKLTYQLVIN